jgi:hypothetical protein
LAALRVKRGTRAQLDAAAASSGLATGEPYLITDDGMLAVGTSASTYEAYARVTGCKAIAVVASLPGTPDANTLYFVTG